MNIPGINPFQPIVAFHIETSPLICSTNQMTSFYIKCNNGLKWIKGICISHHDFPTKVERTIRCYSNCS